MKSDEDLTALHLAVESNKVKLIETLIELGANLEDKNAKQLTALHIAVVHGLSEMVDVLLKHGADVHTRGRKNRSLLLTASMHGPYMDLIEKFIKLGVPIDAKKDNGITLLHCAIDCGGRKEVVKLAISHGADVNAVTEMKTTPLFYAVDNDDFEVVQILLKNGANHFGFVDLDKIYEKIKLWLSMDRLKPKMVIGINKDKVLKARKIKADRRKL